MKLTPFSCEAKQWGDKPVYYLIWAMTENGPVCYSSDLKPELNKPAEVWLSISGQWRAV